MSGTPTLAGLRSIGVPPLTVCCTGPQSRWILPGAPPADEHPHAALARTGHRQNLHAARGGMADATQPSGVRDGVKGAVEFDRREVWRQPIYCHLLIHDNGHHTLPATQRGYGRV